MSAYIDGLKLLGRRELSVSDLRSRLLDREHTPERADDAIARLLETGALDDRRVARAYARTASKVKGRGRLRVTRELQAMGIARDVIAEAVGDVFGEIDERAMIDRAVQKKLRGRKPSTMQERARLYQFLMRQGFTPAAVTAALRRTRRDD
ncbi:MAG: RecX family transcriptional regulator [Acidobacteria bacterium]|nr:RecX family transcriptional regulator [Acidobacteriota bacterium]